MPPSTTTQVEIFGEVYNVRGSDENGHLQELADLVDRKMREVAEHVKGDTARIAILAALNLADELLQSAESARRGTGRDQGEGGGADRGINSRPGRLNPGYGGVQLKI